MKISEKLLKEMKTWDTKQVPQVLFHGCRDSDNGLDLKKGTIAGAKWFSTDAAYAEKYAYWLRSDDGTPLRLQVDVVHKHYAIESPSRLEGANWAPFLAECFKDIPPGYGLSYHFQDTLKLHLDALAVDGLYSYISKNGVEVCIPEAEKFVVIRQQEILPKTKIEYLRKKGIL